MNTRNIMAYNVVAVSIMSTPVILLYTLLAIGVHIPKYTNNGTSSAGRHIAITLTSLAGLEPATT